MNILQYEPPMIPIQRAPEQWTEMLIEKGILYVDETGIHVKENRPS